MKPRVIKGHTVQHFDGRLAVVLGREANILVVRVIKQDGETRLYYNYWGLEDVELIDYNEDWHVDAAAPVSLDEIHTQEKTDLAKVPSPGEWKEIIDNAVKVCGIPREYLGTTEDMATMADRLCKSGMIWGKSLFAQQLAENEINKLKKFADKDLTRTHCPPMGPSSNEPSEIDLNLEGKDVRDMPRNLTATWKPFVEAEKKPLVPWKDYIPPFKNPLMVGDCEKMFNDRKVGKINLPDQFGHITDEEKMALVGELAEQMMKDYRKTLPPADQLVSVQPMDAPAVWFARNKNTSDHITDEEMEKVLKTLSPAAIKRFAETTVNSNYFGTVVIDKNTDDECKVVARITLPERDDLGHRVAPDGQFFRQSTHTPRQLGKTIRKVKGDTWEGEW